MPSFSVRQLVDENGDLALTRSYDPFGLVLQETGSGEALFGFMGAQAGGMGLLYVGGRYYDPRTGRFLSPNHDNFDPKRPGTLNPYLSIIFLGPLLLLAGRRRLKGKKRYVTIWLLVGFSLTTVLTGCGEQESGGEAPTAIPTDNGRANFNANTYTTSYRNFVSISGIASKSSAGTNWSWANGMEWSCFAKFTKGSMVGELAKCSRGCCYPAKS
jgi:RHS repeat-associated protein